MRPAVPAPKIWAGGIRPPRLVNLVEQHDWVIGVKIPRPLGSASFKERSYDRSLVLAEYWMRGAQWL